MGTIELSALGKLSGRIGPVVAYVTKDGRQHFRTYTKPADPCTPRQMACRMKLGLVNKALSPLNKVIRWGYPGDAAAYRTLVGRALREAVEGAYPHFRFNYSKIAVARGLLQLPANVRMACDAATREARFSWDVPLASATEPGSCADKVAIVTLHASRYPEVITHHAGRRDAGEAVFPLPGGWEAAQTHYWLYLTSPDLQQYSNSLYLCD
jgi:hypothetical protein